MAAAGRSRSPYGRAGVPLVPGLQPPGGGWWKAVVAPSGLPVPSPPQLPQTAAPQVLQFQRTEPQQRQQWQQHQPEDVDASQSQVAQPLSQAQPLRFNLAAAQGLAAQAAVKQRLEQEEATARLRRSVESSEGYFEPKLGYVLTTEDSRYTVISKSPLGVGVFSVVWPCADKNNKLIALKVVRWQDHFRRFADKEVETLRRVKELAENDLEGSAQVATLRDHFLHRCPGPSGGEVEHLCMAFEKLEYNLRSIGKQPLEKVLAFSKQLLLALRYLHDTVGLAHCDVKPDNLLLRWDGLAVKLCDFGTARFSVELQNMDDLQPLFYRAPEVFVGSTRGRKIDLWSAGCTIYELVVGRILFRACNTNREIVEKMMQLRGPLPVVMREQGRLSNCFFSPKGFHPEVGEPVDPDKAYKKTPMLGELAPYIDFGKVQARLAQEQARAQLAKLIGKTTVLSAATKKTGAPTEGERKLRQLAELIEACMEVDPSNRISAAAACQHEVIKAVALPPHADLQEAPPLPTEAPPPLPPKDGDH